MVSLSNTKAGSLISNIERTPESSEDTARGITIHSSGRTAVQKIPRSSPRVVPMLEIMEKLAKAAAHFGFGLVSIMSRLYGVADAEKRRENPPYSTAIR